jgi:diguanylate cyclase (GGDEF)-like protein
MSIYAKITAILLVCLIGYGIIGINNYHLINGLIDHLAETDRQHVEYQKISNLLMEQIHLLDSNIEKSFLRITDENRSLFVAEELFGVLRREIKAFEHGEKISIPYNGNKTVVHIPSFSELNMSPEAVLLVRQGLQNIETGLKALHSQPSNRKAPGISVKQSDIDKALSKIRRGLLAISRIETAIAAYSSSQLKNNIDQVIAVMQQYILHINILVAGVIFVLTLASYIWGWFLITPVRHMMNSLEEIIFAANNDGACGNIKEIPVVGLDEIGKVAHLTNILIAKIRTQCNFRRTIEADETAHDIYNRLADLFIQKLGLHSFVIYENRSKKDSLEPVFVWPPEMESELPDIQPTSRCRAKRTGALVSSIENSKICPMFPWQDAMSHLCIPMMVGGEILGVVQFMFPFVNCLEREKKMRQAVKEAQQFLQEALPVLKAKRLAQNLKEMATKDQLTGLFNRHYLEIYLDNIVAGIKRRNACLGILMCDLDYFKKVNDEYGHDVGDVVLQKLASILRSHARDADLVIRFGGEEFLLMLVDCEPGESMKVAERIRSAVEGTIIRLPGIEFAKTISVGVSEFPVDGTAIWEAIKYADVALYEAKSRGRNLVIRFERDMWDENSY